MEKFRQAAPHLTTRQLREKVLAANCRLVGTLHLAIQVRAQAYQPGRVQVAGPPQPCRALYL